MHTHAHCHQAAHIVGTQVVIKHIVDHDLLCLHLHTPKTPPPPPRKFTSDVQRGSHQQLYVPMGCDRMSDIGTAPGASQPGPQGWLQALSAACGGQSTQSIQSTEIPGVQSRDTHPHQGVGGGGVIDWDMYAEPGVCVSGLVREGGMLWRCAQTHRL